MKNPSTAISQAYLAFVIGTLLIVMMTTTARHLNEVNLPGLAEILGTASLVMLACITGQEGYHAGQRKAREDALARTMARLEQPAQDCLSLTQHLYGPAYFGDQAADKPSSADIRLYEDMCQRITKEITEIVNDNKAHFQQLLDTKEFTNEELMALLITCNRGERTLASGLLNLTASYLDLQATVAFLRDTGSDRDYGHLCKFARVNREVFCCRGLISFLRTHYLDTSAPIPQGLTQVVTQAYHRVTNTIQNEFSERPFRPAAGARTLLERQCKTATTLATRLLFTNQYLSSPPQIKTTRKLEEQLRGLSTSRFGFVSGNPEKDDELSNC